MPIVMIQDIKIFLLKLLKANELTQNSVKWGQQEKTIKEHENTSKASPLKFLWRANSCNGEQESEVMCIATTIKKPLG